MECGDREGGFERWFGVIFIVAKILEFLVVG